MRFWSGDTIKELKENQVFVFGSNPSGLHGAGAAKAAVAFGAKYGVGRGLQGQSYALITKNLKAGYHEKETGITYATEGYKSLSPEQISENIRELYQCAKQHPDKFFIMAYKNETWPNGSSKKSLNGYTSEEMFTLFMNDGDIPANIILHNSFKPLAKNYLEANKVEPEQVDPKEEATQVLKEKYRTHDYDGFIVDLIDQCSTFEKISTHELAAGLIAGKTAFDIVNDHYKEKTPENIIDYLDEMNTALNFNERMFSNVQLEHLELMEKAYNLAVSKVIEIHGADKESENKDHETIMLEILDEQEIKYFINLTESVGYLQVNGSLVESSTGAIYLPDQEFEIKGVTFQNTPNVLEMMHWQFIGDFEIATNHQGSATQPEPEAPETKPRNKMKI
ncbi:hypothetical protein SOX05_08625 [Pseudomonas putida]|nr:hypothetical protein [Pseudomonas putida]MDY4319325.1 hypothetical protein [Pseudomonas putida]MDY4352710.1 hypothetical protein [Pseudomonas putida]